MRDREQEWEPQVSYDQPKDEREYPYEAPPSPYYSPTRPPSQHMNGWEFLQWLLTGIGHGIAAACEWIVDDDRWVIFLGIALGIASTLVTILAGIFHWMK